MSETTIEALAAEVQRLSARVQELLDRAEIAELKARYFRLVDEKDWDAWRELFTDDAQFYFGGARRIDGGEAFVSAVRGMLDGAPGRARSVHRGHMPELTVDSPTEAHGSWGLADYIEWPPDRETGTRTGFRGYGHEIETYRKVDGVWKIASWRLRYLRKDPLPREHLPEQILGGPDTLRDPDYIEQVTAPG